MKGILVMAALVAVAAGALTNGCPKELSTTLLPDFRDCAGFWKCADGLPLFQSCPEGLHFSDRLQRCTVPVFARCQAVDGDAPIHATLTSILDTLRNVISRKAQPEPPMEDELPAPPELPTGDLPDEEDTFRRFPDPDAEAPELPDEADAADGETEDAEKSQKEQNSADVEVKEELDTMGEVEQDDRKEEEQDESERSEEKIDEEEDEVDSDKEEPEEKVDETSDVEDVVAENDGEIRQDSKKDVTVVKKDEEEEDEHKKKSKDVKSIEKESKKNKSEEKEKDSESEAESDDEE